MDMKKMVVVIAVAIALTGLASAQLQSGECQFNPQDPQCHAAPPDRAGQFSITPDQLEQEKREAERQQDNARHTCEIQAENAYQECVRSGLAFCSLQVCR